MGSVVRMEVPGARFGRGCLLAFLAVLLLITVLASFHLAHPLEYGVAVLVLAVFWQWVVHKYVAARAQDAGGWKRYLVDAVADLVSGHFVEVDRNDPERPVVNLGYRLSGRDWYLLKVPSHGVEGITWSQGQAGDWIVWLRFKKGLAEPRQHFDIRQVGPSGPRKEAEALGCSLADFLSRAGVPLAPDLTSPGFVQASGT